MTASPGAADGATPVRRGAVLAGQTAIVTGSAGGGLGTAIARVLAAAGARVVVTGRRPEAGEAVAGSLQAAGATAFFHRADLAVASDCDALARVTAERFGAATILVNNAVRGVSGDGPVDEMRDEVWEQTLAVNLTGAMRMCRATIPAMRAAGGGSIVNISSRVARQGAPGLAAYTASKGALDALTRSIAMDVAADGIRCNAVAPAYLLGKDRDGDPSPEVLARFGQGHATAIPTVDDVAFAVLYLCTPEAARITGVTLPVDGGASSMRPAVIG